MNTKPYPYQLEGVNKIVEFGGRALLADEMGLGKTLQALLYIRDYLEKGPIVIVCPATIKWTWSGQAKQHIRRHATVLETKTPPRRPGGGVAQIYIINFDILGNPDNKNSWVSWLKKVKPQLIVIDECHAIKNLKAQRTKAVQELCDRVPHVIAISGTPLLNQPAELWPVLNILKPDKWPSFYAFTARHCIIKQTPWGIQFKGAKKLPQLNKKLLKYVMIRRRKEDVLKDLPPKQRSIVPVDIRNRREYEEAENQFVMWLASKFSKSRANRAARAERLVKMGYLKRLAAQLKYENIVKWIKDFLADSDGKLIIFGIHKVILEGLYEEFKKISVLVNGTVPAEERTKRIKKFNKDHHCRLFIGNVDAAGVGWSATSASAVLFVELPWVPGKVIQAEDRIHGIGRGVAGVKASITYLVARNTIEERLCEVLETKQNTADQILDGSEGLTGLDVYDQLTSILTRRKNVKK